MTAQNEQHEDDLEEQEAEVNRTLFIRGLPEKTTEDELYELFLQAGPLEKVAIPQNKNIAFITYKHSISAPYAKELFCDTRLHGRVLNVGFRTGSSHSGQSGNNRQSGHANHNSNQQSPYNRPQQSNLHDNRNNRNVQHNNCYGSNNMQAGFMPSPVVPGMVYGNGLMASPFAGTPLSMPIIQGYRSSADNREYVPQYISFDSPPSAFIGSAPINHPDHPVALDDRRQRLMSQQRYITQADIQRNQGQFGGHRR